jgi:ABC-type nitrate/sulfonate/bicarbonate transport system ATPase subunit
MSHLVVDGLRLLYEQGAGGEDFLALDDVNFAIGDGEFVTIVGPSGCGKSTLLMLIAALLRPSAGSIRLNGRAVATPGWDRALVFQDFALLPWRTVLKNVELGLELKGARRSRAVTSKWSACVPSSGIFPISSRAACASASASPVRSASSPRFC